MATFISAVTTNNIGRREKTKLNGLIEDKDWDEVLKMLSTEEGHNEARVVWDERQFRRYRFVRDAFIPLHEALNRKAPLEVVESLIRAFPKGLNLPSPFKQLPIHVACRNGACAEVVKLLLQRDEDGPQVAAGRSGGSSRNPLHYVCMGVGDIRLDLVNIVIDACPDAVKRVDKCGYLPLHYAATNRGRTSAAVVDTLLQSYPGGARIADRSGNLPLHLAVQEVGQVRNFSSRRSRYSDLGEVIRLLLESFPDAVKSWNQNSELPIHIGCNNRFAHPIFIEPLLRLFPDGARTQNINGCLPITMLSSSLRSFNSRSLSSEEGECAKLLMLTAYHGTIDKKTHLIHAYAAGGEDCPIEMLNDVIAEHPHQLREADNDGNLPLHLEAARAWGWKGQRAEKNGEVGRLETLLQAFPEGALVKNRAGKVPLLMALEVGRDPNSCEMWKLFQATLPIILGGEDALCVTLLEHFAYSWTDALYVMLRQGFLARNATHATDNE